jgi:hypothetical protein
MEKIFTYHYWTNTIKSLCAYTICAFVVISCASPNTPISILTTIETPAPPLQETWVTNPNYRTGLAWFYKPPEDELLPILSEQFDFFILTHRDEEYRDILRSLGVTQPIPNYLLFTEIHDPGGCDEKPRGNQVAYQRGDFCRISVEHPDWFLLDTFGNRIVDDDGSYYHMDPGNPGFRAFWLERALELQHRYNWNGVFIDNVEGSLSKYKRQGALPIQYLTDTSLQTAVEGFLAYLSRQGLRPLYANIISVEKSEVWLRYIEYLDGAMLENFAVDWRDSTLSVSEWTTEMEMLAASQQIGKTLILVAQGSQDDLSRQQFAYASYLLANEGLAYFRYTHHSAYREIWWYGNYNIDLGTPLSPAYQNGEIWIREFEYGQVIVNPRKNTAELILSEAMP